MVIFMGNGVLKANDSNILPEFGGHITLTDNWTRGVLQSMDWVKRRETTGKIEPSPQLIAEEKFTFQKSIATVVFHHVIPSDLIISVDHTPLSNGSPGK